MPARAPEKTAGAASPATGTTPHAPPGQVNPSQSASQQAAVQGKVSLRTAQPTAPSSIPSTKGPRSNESAPAAPGISLRRDQHIDHPVAMPGGRERGSGGSGRGGQGMSGRWDGPQDIHDWMPFSAQVSRISRPHIPLPHLNPLRALSPLGRLAMPFAFCFDLVTSMFRRTPAHVHAERRDTRDASEGKARDRKLKAGQARRDERAETHATRGETRQGTTTRKVFAENPGGGPKSGYDPSRTRPKAPAGHLAFTNLDLPPIPVQQRAASR